MKTHGLYAEYLKIMKKEKKWQEFANNLMTIKELKDMLDNETHEHGKGIKVTISLPKITVLYPDGTEEIYIGEPE